MDCFARCVQSRKDCIDLMHGDDGKGGIRFKLKLAEWPGDCYMCVGRVCDGGGGELGARGRGGCDAQVSASCRASGQLQS